MKNFSRLICFVIALCLLIVLFGVNSYGTDQTPEIKYMGCKDFSDANEYDVFPSRCYIDFENDVLNVRAGKEGSTNTTINGCIISMDLPYTNVSAKTYPYLAIRLKTQEPSTGGSIVGYVGYTTVLSADPNDKAGPQTVFGGDKTTWKASYEYENTTDWQTVVIDFSDLAAKTESYKKYMDKIDLLPFNKSSISNGTTVSIDSFAFFKNATDAKNFTGNLEDYTDKYAAQSQEWLASEFVNPNTEYKMIKFQYDFNENYQSLLEELYKGYGYAGVSGNVALNEEYLKDIKEFDLLDSAFAHALELGMTQLWLQDEYNFPSGMAYGQVLEEYPEGEAVGVGQIIETGSGNSEYTLKEGYEKIVHAILETNGKKQSIEFENNKISINVSGDWTLYVYGTYYPYVDPGASFPNWQRKKYINIMDETAVATYIELTHSRHAQYLDETFSSVEAYFTEEPSLITSYLQGVYPMTEYLMPWVDSLPEKFENMHGYSLLNNMTSLYGGDTEWDKVVRINFYETIAELVATTFFKQIETWCAANGTALSGHLLLEEWMTHHVICYGDMMKCLNEMGIPGGDFLQIEDNFMDTDTFLGAFPAFKYPSSSARNTGKRFSFMEYNPEAIPGSKLYTDVFGVSINGLTLSMLFGTNKIFMLNPQETYNAWQSRKMNDYVGRINTIIDGAVMNSGIAVYYPVASMQAMLNASSIRTGDIYNLDSNFNKFCKTLLEGGLDYNYLDADTILKSTIKDGKMICSNTEYSIVLMPFVDAMSSKVMEKLAEFESQGGQIIWVNNIPSFATDYENNDKLLSMLEKYKNSVQSFDGTVTSKYNLTEKIKAAVNYGYDIDCHDEGVLISPLAKDNRQIAFIANTNSSETSMTVSFGENKSFSVYDPFTGVISKYTGETDITCAGYRGLLIVGEYEGVTVNPVGIGNTTSESNTFTIILIVSIAAIVVAVGVACTVILIKSKKKNPDELQK